MNAMMGPKTANQIAHHKVEKTEKQIINTITLSTFDFPYADKFDTQQM